MDRTRVANPVPFGSSAPGAGCEFVRRGSRTHGMPVLVENTDTGCYLGLRGWVVLVGEAAEDRSSSDPVEPSRQRDHGRVVVGCAEFHTVALVAAAGVVVRDVPVEDVPQVPLANGEHPVGAFRTHRADETLGDRVHPWRLRRGHPDGDAD